MVKASGDFRVGNGFYFRRSIKLRHKLTAQCLGADNKISDLDIGLQTAATSQSDKGSLLLTLQSFDNGNYAGGGADAGGQAGNRYIFVSSSYRQKFPVWALQSYVIKKSGQAADAVGGAGSQDKRCEITGRGLEMIDCLAGLAVDSVI